MSGVSSAVALWVARAVLAVVFGAAGTAKLRDHDASLAGTSALGVSRRLSPVVARLVPVAELAVAALLLVPPVSPFAAAAGLVLLAGFTVAISAALLRGRTPVCFCFGSKRARPVGTDAIVRNVALATLCVVVVVQH